MKAKKSPLFILFSFYYAAASLTAGQTPHSSGNKKEITQEGSLSISEQLNNMYILDPKTMPQVRPEARVGKVCFAYRAADGHRVVVSGTHSVLYDDKEIRLVSIHEEECPEICKVKYKEEKSGGLFVTGISVFASGKTEHEISVVRQSRYLVNEEQINWGRARREIYFYKQNAQYLPDDLEVFVTIGAEVIRLKSKSSNQKEGLMTLSTLRSGKFDSALGAEYTRFFREANSELLVSVIPIKENPIGKIQESKFQSPEEEEILPTVAEDKSLKEKEQNSLRLWGAKIKGKMESLCGAKDYAMASAGLDGSSLDTESEMDPELADQRTKEACLRALMESFSDLHTEIETEVLGLK